MYALCSVNRGQIKHVMTPNSVKSNTWITSHPPPLVSSLVGKCVCVGASRKPLFRCTRRGEGPRGNHESRCCLACLHAVGARGNRVSQPHTTAFADLPLSIRSVPAWTPVSISCLNSVFLIFSFIHSLSAQVIYYGVVLWNQHRVNVQAILLVQFSAGGPDQPEPPWYVRPSQLQCLFFLAFSSLFLFHCTCLLAGCGRGIPHFFVQTVVTLMTRFVAPVAQPMLWLPLSHSGLRIFLFLLVERL